MRVGKRRRSSLIHATWFCALIGGFTGCQKATGRSVHVQIEHVGGAPYALRPVVPFYASESDLGWWSATEVSELGDTLYSDEKGHIRIPIPRHGRAWSGLLCELDSPDDSKAWFACPLTDGGCEDLVSCTLPGSVHIRFVGNRMGLSAEPGCWIADASEPVLPTPDQWFTPGVPPTPSLVLFQWLNSNESLPAQRIFHLIDMAGATTVLPAIYIHSEHIGDTIVQPISF